MAVKDGYSKLQIGLHWVTAFLVAGAYFTSDGMGRALELRQQTGATGIEGNTLHVWMGGTAFAVILIRLVVRRIQGAPGSPEGTPPLMETAAVWGHRLLYVLMVAVPLGGAATWYGGLPLGDGHEIAGNALMLLAVGHAVVAILHQALLQDGVLMRMFSPKG